jgi:hypothetical protein
MQSPSVLEAPPAESSKKPEWAGREGVALILPPWQFNDARPVGCSCRSTMRVLGCRFTSHHPSYYKQLTCQRRVSPRHMECMEQEPINTRNYHFSRSKIENRGRIYVHILKGVIRIQNMCYSPGRYRVSRLYRVSFS